MRIKDGFILREVAGSYVVVNVSGELDFNGMITLNDTGAYIWKKLDSGLDIDAIVESIVGEYEVDAEIARRDVKAFIAKMSEAGIVE